MKKRPSKRSQPADVPADAEVLEMRIAVSARGKNLDADVDPRFGRASYILIVDSDTWEVEVVDNSENLNALKGAGIQAAADIGAKGVDVLLTGHCGPNAFKALKAGQVLVANNAEAEGTVRKAVQAYLDGRLPVADEADVEGQW